MRSPFVTGALFAFLLLVAGLPITLVTAAPAAAQQRSGLIEYSGWRDADELTVGARHDWRNVNTDGRPDRAVINGRQGYRLRVRGPGAQCGPAGDLYWTFGTPEIVSGRLPAGMRFLMRPEDGYYAGDYVGIPEERGHFYVTIRVPWIQCNGEYYPGFTQELEFHITGSGQVVQ